MREQLLLLIRISKPEYNKTLYDEYKVYMNPQMAFNKRGLTEGQYDKFEGAITNIPCKLQYSVDEKKSWHVIGDTTIIYKDNNAYIYCMYGLRYDENCYDAKSNKYTYTIPWKYIEGLWQGAGTELMVIKNTKVFVEKLKKAAEEAKFEWAYGKVAYDLEDKLSDVEYFKLARNDLFESVYHKCKERYEIQKEVRFSVINPDRPAYIELQLEKDQTLYFDCFTLEYGKDIVVELSNLKLDIEHNVSVRFLSNITYYESKNDKE